MERGLRALKAFQKARSQNKFPEVDSTMQAQILPHPSSGAVVDATTLICKNDGKLPNGTMVDQHHHIATTMGRGDQKEKISHWWGNDLVMPPHVWVQSIKAMAMTEISNV